MQSPGTILALDRCSQVFLLLCSYRVCEINEHGFLISFNFSKLKGKHVQRFHYEIIFKCKRSSVVVSNDMPQTRLPDSAVAWKNDKFPKGVKDVGVLTIQVNAQSDDPVK